MKWEEVQTIYPDQFVKFEILHSFEEDNNEIIDEVALIGPVKDEDATKELTNFYRWNLAAKTHDASTPISEKDMLKKVFEYVVINYIGGNFMDAMRFVEECLNGLSMKEIEE